MLQKAMSTANAYQEIHLIFLLLDLSAFKLFKLSHADILLCAIPVGPGQIQCSACLISYPSCFCTASQQNNPRSMV